MHVTYESNVSYEIKVDTKPTCCGRRTGGPHLACGSCPFN